MSPEACLGRVESLFTERGGDEYHGEAVSQLEHALQAAAFGEAENRPAAWVVAALLHDVGHMLHNHGEGCSADGIDDRHEELGVRFLRHAFGPEVTEPIRLHVIAKRYLTAKEPDYLGKLSPTSQQSLRLQGGPMTPGEVAEFEAHPNYESAVAVRRWDELAKVPGRSSPGFSHYLPMLRSLLKSGDRA